MPPQASSEPPNVVLPSRLFLPVMPMGAEEKLVNFHVAKSRVFHVFIFVFTLSIGITACLYLESFSSHLQAPILFATEFKISVPLEQTGPFPIMLMQEKEEELMSLDHNLTDAELFWRASMVSIVHDYSVHDVPKVAFMFMTKGHLPLAPLWDKFFQGHKGFYSIYVHIDPLFNFSMPESSVFHQRAIPSKTVEWGKPSMIDAERRLLANALLDFSNKRFVLLSESCIPLFNFTTVYNYLMNTNLSFIGSFDDPRRVGRGRYNKLMWPTITVSDWRKGSQWFEVSRDVAIEIISDVKYYNLFTEFCAPPCYTDEHYLPTPVNIRAPARSSNRSITWVDWSRAGPHPGKFNRWAISADFLKGINNITTCTYNDKIVTICFLFGRKFLPCTLQPLLKLTSVLFDDNV